MRSAERSGGRSGDPSVRTPHRLASFLLAAAALLIITGNLPDSELRDRIDAVLAPVRAAAGLEQNWGVYSQPRTLSAYVDAQVEDRDGSVTTYPIPDRRDLWTYVDYRWQKYEEVLRPDTGRDDWSQYARFVARRSRADGHDPVRVTLVRRFSETNPPGPGPARGPWRSFVMTVVPIGSRP